MIADVLGHLRCPHCHAGLALAAGTARCPSGHVFDLARQGYLTLLAARALLRNADTAAMVAARRAFLAAGHFRFLAEALAARASAVLAASGSSTADRCVLDIGGGTGYHLAAVLDALPGRRGIVLDLSRHAARQAVRAHPRADAVVADTWQPLPVRTGAAALALNVFAPRNGAELRRVLQPEGALLVVTPTPAHLAELVGPLGLLSVDPRKAERVAGQLDRYFTGEAGQRLDRTLLLSHPEVMTVAAMGPSARHGNQDRLSRMVSRLPDPFPVTASFHTVTYRLRM